MLCSWCKALTSKSWIGCSIDASLNSMGAIQFQNKQSMDKENFKEKKNCSKHVEWKSTHMSHFSQRFSHYCKSHFFTWVLGDKQLWIFGKVYIRLTLYNAYCQLCFWNCQLSNPEYYDSWPAKCWGNVLQKQQSQCKPLPHWCSHPGQRKCAQTNLTVDFLFTV